MNRKMYWGVAILILLIIGVSVFMLTRTTETEPETVYNPLTEADKKQVELEKQQPAEKPQVTEVSKGTGKRVEDMTDEELRNSYSRYSPAKLEWLKKADQDWYKQLEKSVPRLEASVKRNSENMQKYPYQTYYRHEYERDSRSLKHESARLARLKRILEVVHNVK